MEPEIISRKLHIGITMYWFQSNCMTIRVTALVDISRLVEWSNHLHRCISFLYALPPRHSACRSGGVVLKSRLEEALFLVNQFLQVEIDSCVIPLIEIDILGYRGWGADP